MMDSTPLYKDLRLLCMSQRRLFRRQDIVKRIHRHNDDPRHIEIFQDTPISRLIGSSCDNEMEKKELTRRH